MNQRSSGLRRGYRDPLTDEQLKDVRMGQRVEFDATARHYGKPKFLTIGDGSRIDGYTIFVLTGPMTIGRGVHISSHCKFNSEAGITIGDRVQISSHVRAFSASTDFKELEVIEGVPFVKQHKAPIYIDSDVTIGSGVVIVPGIRIHEGAAVGANAVVTQSIPAWEIWAGVPAVKIGERKKTERSVK